MREINHNPKGSTRHIPPEEIKEDFSKRYEEELLDDDLMEAITEDMGDDLYEIRIYECDRMERFVRNNSI